MSKLKRQLTLKEGIPLGIGFIIGSGVLFLPSMTYEVAGRDVLLVWVLTILLCLPGLFFFADMVRAVPDESGMAGFVKLGMGRHWAASVPVLFLLSVPIGESAAAIVAATYLQNLFPEKTWVLPLGATFLVAFGVITNLLGIRVSGLVSKVIAFLLFFVGGALFLMTLGPAIPKYSELTPVLDWSNLGRGVVLAFFAFSGFENFTFLAGEFENPKRDLVLSAVAAVLICGLLYIALTANYAAIIDEDSIDSVAGLFQLSAMVEPAAVTTVAIAAFAFVSVQINIISWVAGTSRAIYSSAQNGILPNTFAHLNSKSIPTRAILLKAAIFAIALPILIFYRERLDDVLTLISTNLMILYFVAVLSYALFTKSKIKGLIAWAAALAIGAALLSSAWFMIFGVGVMAISYSVSVAQGRKSGK